MQDRRTFLATLAALAAGCTTPTPGIAHDSGVADQAPDELPIGIQLYTVRSLLARDFAGTLEQLAAIGYGEVEFAGYHGHRAAQVRSRLDSLGLRAPSAHVPVDDIRGAWNRVLDDAQAVGHRWVTVPWVAGRDWGEKDWRELAELLNARGADAARAGLRMAYHNHDFELRGDRMPAGRPPLELLLAETDPAFVDFELDVYWLVHAGQDPVTWLGRHGRRVRMLHVKDSAGAPEHRMVDVGAGTIDWEGVIGTGRRNGVQHLFVEHDQPADPLATARASFAHLAHLPARAAR